jgi:hypothetical protein
MRFALIAGTIGSAATLAVYWVPASIAFSMEVYDQRSAAFGAGSGQTLRDAHSWILWAIFTLAFAAVIGLLTGVIASTTREGRYDWDDDPRIIAISIGGATAASAAMVHAPFLFFALFIHPSFLFGVFLCVVAVIAGIATALAWFGAHLAITRPH